MTNRRQKAMEEKHIKYSSNPKKSYDMREEITLERVLKGLNGKDHWNIYGMDERNYFCTFYKNGGKMYDLAKKLLNSPLYKALS